MRVNTIIVAALLISLTLSGMAMGYVSEKDTYYVTKYYNKTFTLAPSADEIIVKFAEGADFAQFENAYNLEKAQVLDEAKLIGVYSIPSGFTMSSTLDIVNSDISVRRAAPAYTDHEGFTKYCVPTELTVQFNDNISEARMMEIISEVGSEVVRDQWTAGYYTISAPSDHGYFYTIRELNKYDEVKFSEPSIISYNDATWTPNDTYFNEQWPLRNTGQDCSGCTPYSDHDIDAEDGWDTGRGDPDVIVSVIDTGMDLSHPDLAGNLLPRNGEDWDFADPDGSPDDEGNHGTACSGIAVAIANNALGVAGVANQCRIMPLRINLTSGYNQNRADAINYATSRRPDFDGLVLSNSWRMSSGDYSAVQAAIENAYANDVLVCFSAGNGNGSVQYPARYPEAMAIAASSPCDERVSPSSCDGEWWGSDYGEELDCAAPGVKIYTTDRQGGAGYSSGDYYDSFNGTSAACPHVAGVGAVVWALNPSLSNVEVREIINESADQVGGYYYNPNTGKSNELGHGRINLAGAAALVSDPPCCSVDMVPDESPVFVEPGGTFGLTGYVSNPTENNIVTDVWVGVKYMGTFYQLWRFNNIFLTPGQTLSSHLNQTVPNYAPEGTYDYAAYCGEWNYEKCDSASFPFTVGTLGEGFAYVVMHNGVHNYFTLDDFEYGGTVKDFEDVPETYWYHGGNQNLGTFYSGLEFGQHAVILEDLVYGYNSSSYPPHSGHQVLYTPSEYTSIRVDFDVNQTQVGVWYTSGVNFYLEGYDEFGNLLAEDSGPSNIGNNTYLEIIHYGVDSKTYTDIGDLAGWKLEGAFGELAGESAEADIPTAFELIGNYPNPFNATTSISFQVPHASDVTLEVFNILGQKVATLIDGRMETGTHTVSWDASSNSSGVYFYKLTAGDLVYSKKMSLLK